MLAGELTAIERIHGDQHSIGAVAESQRNDQPIDRLKPELAQTMLLKAPAIERLGQPLGLTRPQGRARHRIGQTHPPADQTPGQLTGPSRDHQLITLSELDHQRTRRHQRTPTLGHQLQDRPKISLTTQRPRNLNRRIQRTHRALQLSPLVLGPRVAPRMIDRHPGKVRQQNRRLLVILIELHRVLLIGQVQISKRLTGGDNRDPQKRPHRRMTHREPIRVWMPAHVSQPQRHRIEDQLTQHPTTPRQRADPLPGRLVHAEREKPRQPRPRLVQHPQAPHTAHRSTHAPTRAPVQARSPDPGPPRGRARQTKVRAYRGPCSHHCRFNCPLVYRPRTRKSESCAEWAR